MAIEHSIPRLKSSCTVSSGRIDRAIHWFIKAPWHVHAAMLHKPPFTNSVMADAHAVHVTPGCLLSLSTPAQAVAFIRLRCIRPCLRTAGAAAGSRACFGWRAESSVSSTGAPCGPRGGMPPQQSLEVLCTQPQTFFTQLGRRCQRSIRHLQRPASHKAVSCMRIQPACAISSKVGAL